jgi:hypothetical protein
MGQAPQWKDSQGICYCLRSRMAHRVFHGTYLEAWEIWLCWTQVNRIQGSRQLSEAHRSTETSLSQYTLIIRYEAKVFFTLCFSFYIIKSFFHVRHTSYGFSRYPLTLTFYPASSKCDSGFLSESVLDGILSGSLCNWDVCWMTLFRKTL